MAGFATPTHVLLGVVILAVVVGVRRLIASALLGSVLTRALALPLFLLVFFAVWACGYWVLVRRYRQEGGPRVRARPAGRS